MEQQDLWKRFERSGSVKDYLRYIGMAGETRMIASAGEEYAAGVAEGNETKGGSGFDHARRTDRDGNGLVRYPDRRV